MLLPLAHAGHILIDGPLYGGPVLILLGGLYAFSKLEHRLVDEDEVD
jgi:hypothetical protein